MPTDHFLERTRRLALRARETPQITSLRDWFPLALQNEHIIWRHLPERFTTPFFLDMLAQQAPEQRQACITPMSYLTQLAPALPPAAFIFHTSRCGSTLLAQMLATLPECIVLSEAPMIDTCLRAPPKGYTPEQHLHLLRQAILALGQRRHQETHCIIKLDCWHLPFLPLLRTAFPNTPCWFLYRQPEAILASHQRQRGPQMVPGMIFPAHMPAQAGKLKLTPGDLDGYCLQVLAHLFQHALQYREHLHWLNYSQLPNALWEDFMPQLGLQSTSTHMATMRERAKYHAKNQTHSFLGDSASDFANNAPEHALLPDAIALYQQIEDLRQNTARAHNPL